MPEKPGAKTASLSQIDWDCGPEQHPGTKTPVDEAISERPLRSEGESFRSCVERLVAEVPVLALQAAGGYQTGAARILQMPRQIRALGIEKLGDGVDE